MDALLGGVSVILIIGIVVALLVLFYFIPVRLWITAIFSGVRVRLTDLIGMRLRNVPPSTIVRPLITARKAGIDVTPNQLLVELEVDLDVLQQDVVAERDQAAGLLGTQDTRDLGDRHHVTFLDPVLLDEAEGLLAEDNPTGGDGGTGRGWLRAHVDHAGMAALVDMAQGSAGRRGFEVGHRGVGWGTPAKIVHDHGPGLIRGILTPRW